jgi:hypothetical protein
LTGYLSQPSGSVTRFAPRFHRPKRPSRISRPTRAVWLVLGERTAVDHAIDLGNDVGVKKVEIRLGKVRFRLFDVGDRDFEGRGVVNQLADDFLILFRLSYVKSFKKLLRGFDVGRKFEAQFGT